MEELGGFMGRILRFEGGAMGRRECRRVQKIVGDCLKQNGNSNGLRQNQDALEKIFFTRRKDIEAQKLETGLPPYANFPRAIRLIWNY
jgi:hypothetical protein